MLALDATRELLTTDGGRQLLEIGGDMVLAYVVPRQVERFLAVAARDPHAAAMMHAWAAAAEGHAGDKDRRRALRLLLLAVLLEEGLTFPSHDGRISHELLEFPPAAVHNDAVDALGLCARFFQARAGSTIEAGQLVTLQDDGRVVPFRPRGHTRPTVVIIDDPEPDAARAFAGFAEALEQANHAIARMVGVAAEALGGRPGSYGSAQVHAELHAGLAREHARQVERQLLEDLAEQLGDVTWNPADYRAEKMELHTWDPPRVSEVQIPPAHRIASPVAAYANGRTGDSRQRRRRRRARQLNQGGRRGRR